MKCKRCLNEDPKYFYKGSNGYYCRKCVGFKRVLIEEEIEPFDYVVDPKSFEYSFSYKLTKRQKQVSKQCKNALYKSDVLLHCVCGAGKTELTVESISTYLKKGMKVCYAISRKEVVKELAYRFSKIFINAKVVAVYGGKTKELSGDLIVCTTHQLFRYYKTFDLLILDEVDAFPLKDNDTLMKIAINSCKGRIIYSTATINSFLNKYLKLRPYKEIRLLTRPSGKPIIVPKVYYGPTILQFFILFKLMHNMTNQCIIFVQSKKLCQRLFSFFKHLKSCTYVYSNLEERDKNIKAFKNKEYQFIFATTVLERGITILDVDVIVLDIIQNTFDEASLIQMTGRVGRNYVNPYGDAYILTTHKSKEIDSCVKHLKEANYELSLLR